MEKMPQTSQVLSVPAIGEGEARGRSLEGLESYSKSPETRAEQQPPASPPRAPGQHSLSEGCSLACGPGAKRASRSMLRLSVTSIPEQPGLGTEQLPEGHCEGPVQSCKCRRLSGGRPCGQEAAGTEDWPGREKTGTQASSSGLACLSPHCPLPSAGQRPPCCVCAGRLPSWPARAVPSV